MSQHVVHGERGMLPPQGDHEAGETIEILVLLQHLPVEPTYLVVLAIRVIIPLLGAGHLVPAQQHRSSPRHQEQGDHVLHLPVTKAPYLGIVRGALDAIVRTVILVRAIPVPLPVGLVMLLVIGHQVGQGEPIVTRHIVDAALGAIAGLVAKDVETTRHAPGKIPHHPPIPPHKAPHVVAKAPVPLCPAVARKGSQLVKAGGVPGLGDELGARQHGIGLDAPKNRGIGHGLPLLVARKDRGEVETKAVHVQDVHPVMQTLPDKAAYDGMVAVDGITGAGEIKVVAPVGLEHIIGDILQPAEKYGGPILPPLRRVTKDHVEDDLYPRPMQRLDHIAELVHGVPRIPPAGIGRVGGKVGQGRIAPIICERLAGQGILARDLLGIELLHGEQLHGGDTQLLQVRNLFHKPCIGSPA